MRHLMFGSRVRGERRGNDIWSWCDLRVFFFVIRFLSSASSVWWQLLDVILLRLSGGWRSHERLCCDAAEKEEKVYSSESFNGQLSSSQRSVQRGRVMFDNLLRSSEFLNHARRKKEAKEEMWSTHKGEASQRAFPHTWLGCRARMSILHSSHGSW